jgi:hypothetical protein
MMFPSIILIFILSFVLYFTPILSQSIVIEVKGDCAILGKQVAHEHGYRYVRQVRFFILKVLKNKNCFRFSMDSVSLKKIHCR